MLFECLDEPRLKQASPGLFSRAFYEGMKAAVLQCLPSCQNSKRNKCYVVVSLLELGSQLASYHESLSAVLLKIIMRADREIKVAVHSVFTR